MRVGLSLARINYMEQYLKDENFQPQRAEEYDLLMEVSPSQISYAIVDDINNQLQVLFSSSLINNDSQVSILDRLDTLFNTQAELQLPFRKVKISLQTSQFTFIPNELFDQSLTKEYAKFIQPRTQIDHPVQINDIKSVSIKNVIGLDPELQKILQTHFHQPHFFSQADPFIAGMNQMIVESECTSLGLNIQSASIEIAVFDSGELIFYNLFDCVHADEFNYFLLTTVKELNIDSAQTKILLAGTIEKNDAYYQRIQKYFHDIHFLNTRQLLVQSELTEQLVPHLFFSLISLDLCE